MPQPKVGVLMGSESDLATMEACLERLRTLEVPFEVSILSAHRTPDRARDYLRGARARGIQILIAAAGGAAHLAGFAAAHTDLPVIAIPIDSGILTGLDALLATVQMPGGYPVATMAVGSWGAVNAAILAAEILALHDAELQDRIGKMREGFAAKVDGANRRVREKWSPHGD